MCCRICWPIAGVNATVETDKTRLRPSDIPAARGDATAGPNRARDGPRTIPWAETLADILDDWRRPGPGRGLNECPNQSPGRRCWGASPRLHALAGLCSRRGRRWPRLGQTRCRCSGCCRRWSWCCICCNCCLSAARLAGLLVPEAASRLDALFYRLRLVREGIDSLLPVAQVGGELVGAQLLARTGMSLEPGRCFRGRGCNAGVPEPACAFLAAWSDGLGEPRRRHAVRSCRGRPWLAHGRC